MEEDILQKITEELTRSNDLLERQNAFFEILVQMEAVILDVCADHGPTIVSTIKAREIIRTVNTLLPNFNYDHPSRAEQMAEALGEM